MKKFHERLDYLMSDILHISGNGLANTLGLNQGLVNRYRKGETSPSIEFAIAVCEHFGISANWLLLGVGPIKLQDAVEGLTGCEIEIREERRAMVNDLRQLEEFFTFFKTKYSV